MSFLLRRHAAKPRGQFWDLSVCLLSKNIPKKFSIFSLKKRRRSKKVKMPKKQKGRMLTILRVKRVMTEKYGNSQSKQC